jgi:cytidyltransferase-like protein
MKQVVIMPGGFHPFHAGHAALYQKAKEKFPGADVYVAATNDTSKRPFPFQVKEKLAQLAGVPVGRFMQVKSPFGAEEILAPYNPDDTQLIFVKSIKNSKSGPSPEGPFPAEPDPRTGQLPLVTRGARKGLPVSDRLQYYRPGQPMAPMSRHAYLAYLPTVEFGPGMTSGSDIRGVWPKFNEQLKKQSHLKGNFRGKVRLPLIID